MGTNTTLSLHKSLLIDAMGGKFCGSGGCNSWLWWGSDDMMRADNNFKLNNDNNNN